MNTRLLLLLGGGCMAMPPWLTGCATAPAPAHAAAPAVVSAPLRVAQRGHGPLASFALCEAIRCPQPTPKTFAAKVAPKGHMRDPRNEIFVAPVPDRPP